MTKRKRRARCGRKNREEVYGIGPLLFSTRNLFCGRQFFHRLRGWKMVWGWFKHIIFTVYFYFVAIWRYSALTSGSGFMPLWESKGTADLPGGGAQMGIRAMGSGCKALLHPPCSPPAVWSTSYQVSLVYGVLEAKWRIYVQKDVITVSNPIESN